MAIQISATQYFGTGAISFSAMRNTFRLNNPTGSISASELLRNTDVTNADPILPDAKCHWYVMSPDNTFGEGFDWENAPWFDANGLNDVAPMQEVSVVEKLQGKK